VQDQLKNEIDTQDHVITFLWFDGFVQATVRGL
jgi:hypothetical protein